MRMSQWFVMVAALAAASCRACIGDEQRWEDFDAPERDDFVYPVEDSYQLVRPRPARTSPEDLAAKRAQEFLPRLRGLIEMESRHVACPSAQFGVHPGECETDGSQRLLRDFEELAVEYPEHAARLAPDLRRLRTAAIAEVESEFVRWGFDVRKDYAAAFRVRDRCHERAGEGSVDHCPQPGKDVESFFCIFNASVLEDYLALLVALPARASKVRTTSIALARAIEEPEIFFCEGEAQYDYPRAFRLYEQLGMTADMRRVAWSAAEQVLRDDVCHESFTYWDDSDPYDSGAARARVEPAWCAREHLDGARVWFDRAGGIRASEWRKWMEALSREAEMLDLPCDALQFARMAHEPDLQRALAEQYGSSCAALRED